MNKLARYLTIFMLTILSSGCVQDRGSHPPTIALNASLTPARQPTLLHSASPTATHALPSDTPQPTLTLTPSASPTSQPSLTLTRPPKLSFEEQKKRLNWLLRTNGECSIPCVWGFVPGQTTLAEAHNLLLSMDQIIEAPAGSPLEFHFKDDSSLGHIGGGKFTVKAGIIVGIRFLVSLNIQDMQRSDWAAFTPEGIFSAYGIPSGIRFWLNYLQLESEPGVVTHLIDMLLFFDSLAVVVEYKYEYAEPIGDYYRYCPTSIELDSPSVSVSMWVGEEAFYPPEHDVGLPLEGVSLLSSQEFYQQVIDNPGTACFDLLAEPFIWQGQ